MKYLFYSKEGRKGFTSRVRIGENMPIYSSSLDYAVILWRKSDISIVDADGLRVIDLSQGVFKELPKETQIRVVEALNASGSDRKQAMLANKLLPLKKVSFGRDEHGEMQKEYMKRVSRIQSLSLPSEYYPVIKPSGYGYELMFKDLTITTATMPDVELNSLFKVLVGEVTVDELKSVFDDAFDLIAVPDRVRSYVPLRDLEVAMEVSRNSDFPTKKRLRKIMESRFPSESNFIDRCKNRFMGMLGRQEEIPRRATS